MANKRDFKKYVESVGDSACACMVEVFDNVDNVDKEGVAKAVEKVLVAVSTAKSNADVVFDRGIKAFPNISEYLKAKKIFFRSLFKKVTEDFYNEIDEALKLFNASVPDSVKEENKAAANK